MHRLHETEHRPPLPGGRMEEPLRPHPGPLSLQPRFNHPMLTLSYCYSHLFCATALLHLKRVVLNGRIGQWSLIPSRNLSLCRLPAHTSYSPGSSAPVPGTAATVINMKERQVKFPCLPPQPALFCPRLVALVANWSAEPGML